MNATVSRRRPRRLRGRLGAGRAGHRGHAVRDAAGGPDRGAPDRSSRRAGLQQLLQIGRARPTRTACSRPSCGARAACCCTCADEARVPGGAALAVDRDGLLEGGARAGHGASTDHGASARRSRSLPTPGVVATGPLTSTALAEAISRAARRQRARVLRRHRADRERRLARPRACSTRSPATARARATTTSTRRSTADAVRVVHRRAGRGATSSAATTSTRCPIFEGCLPVEEMARRGRETLRFGPMKPVGLARSAHRPRAARGGAAPARGPGGADVEPGRLPDPAPDSGAAAGLPDDSRTRAGGVPAVRQHSPELPTSTVPAALGPALTARDDDRLFFAGQLTGVEGYTESLGTGLLAGINLARRLDGQPIRGTAAHHDAGRAVPLPSGGGSDALPADERELRAARAAAEGAKVKKRR